MDQRAIGDPLLAPQRGIERDRIALEGKVIFQREVDLIDVAGGDVVLDLIEGAAILLARPGQPEVGDFRAPGGAVRVEPGTRARIVERAGLPEQPDPEQRHAALGRQQRSELGLQAIAELIGEESRRMRPAREPGRDLVELGFDLFRRIGRNDPLRLGIEQAPAARRQTVVEKDVRGSGHGVGPVTRFPLGVASIAHMGVRNVNIEGWKSKRGSASRPCRAPTCRPSTAARGRRA